MTLGCTIIARNYLAHARVLAASFLRHHPGRRFVVLVVDQGRGEEVGAGESFEVWGLDDLGDHGRTFREMAAVYSVMELATAVKPWLLERLLAEHDGPVVYLDPDCEVHAPIDDVAEAAMQDGMVLTPHVLAPIPRDGRRPNEADILQSGVYNLGFVAAGPGAVRSGFIDFWRTRLRRDAIVDPERMLFTDQRWVDFADLFPHRVCRDPGCNVAYWNVWGRRLTRDEDGRVLVDGVPLRFFHYSGFDPSRPHLLSVHQGDEPRVRLPDRPLVAELCRDYAGTLLAAGYEDARRQPYGWRQTDGGLTLTPSMRRAYRWGLAHAEETGGPTPPGPFDEDGGAAFAEWLCAPAVPGAVSPLLLGRWELDRSLQVHFPDPLAGSAADYAAWARDDVNGHVAAPTWLYGPATSTPRRSVAEPLSVDDEGPHVTGINVFGYFDSELSVGHVARSVVRAAAAVGMSHDLIASRNAHGSHHADTVLGVRGRWGHDVNVLCVNADRVPASVHELGPAAFAGRPTAGVWFWEAPLLPDSCAEACGLVDEVWAPSRFVADALRATGLPTRLVPPAIEVPTWRSNRTRADLGLPDGFLFLFAFDWLSVSERKNPLGLLEAYASAFEATDGATLVFKTMNGDVAWRELDRLRLAMAGRPDVHLIDCSVRTWEMAAFVASCDCYVSLHRSEGLGLTIAEAMAQAKPTIATGWSGNLDFMDESVAHLVPVELVPIPEDVPFYGGLGEWAEPDLGVAARYMREVFEDRQAAASLGAAARDHLVRTRSLEVAGRALADAADGLRAGWAAR